MCGVFALIPVGPSCYLGPLQVEFVSLSLDIFDNALFSGHIGEWDLSSGDLVETKMHDRWVYRMALKGDLLATSDGQRVLRAFNIPSCLLVILSQYSFARDDF